MSQLEPMSDRAERLLGVGFLAAGIAFAYYFVYSPYSEMVAGAERVEFGFKTAVLGPLLFLIGLLQVAFGERAPHLLGRVGGLTLQSAAIGGAVLAIACAVYFWLNQQAAALGYVSG